MVFLDIVLSHPLRMFFSTTISLATAHPHASRVCPIQWSFWSLFILAPMKVFSSAVVPVSTLTHFALE